MGQNNDYCERCNRQAYYDGHADWCVAMFNLVDRIDELEEKVESLEKRMEIAVPSNPDFPS